MKEPKIISNVEAAQIIAGTPHGKEHGIVWRLIGRNRSWSHESLNVDCFRDSDRQFALIPAEPEIVKPVVVEWGAIDNNLHLLRNSYIPNGPLTVTIRPRAQQDEKDRLEREFVRLCETCYRGDSKIRALADFIKKEMA